jgi:hypothetical protein
MLCPQVTPLSSLTRKTASRTGIATASNGVGVLLD